jgi:hypothetical protein
MAIVSSSWGWHNRTVFARACVALGVAACSGPIDAITLSQTESPAVTKGIGCGPVVPPGTDLPFTSENSYFRVFDLGEFGVRGGFRIQRITFGVDKAIAPDGAASQLGQIVIHAYSGSAGNALDPGAMSVIGAVGINIPTIAVADRRLVNYVLDEEDEVAATPIDIGADVDKIAVEIHSPANSDDDRILLLGGNSDGESSPGYHRCPASDAPMSLASTGFATFNLVLELTGYPIPAPGVDQHPGT